MKPKLGTSITALFMVTLTLRSAGIVAKSGSQTGIDCAMMKECR
jgi:hypothetical protein